MWVLCGVYQILQQNYLSTKNIGGPYGAQCAKMDWGLNDSSLLPWNFAAQLKISHVYFITIYISSSTHESYYWEKVRLHVLLWIPMWENILICILRLWLMSNSGWYLCGILFCFSFPLVSYFSSTRLVKKSRSMTFIYDLLASILSRIELADPEK